MRCKRCRTPKWKGDPCSNPDCVVNTQPTIRLRAKTLPVTMNVKHGYHALNSSTMQLVADYDAPIRSTWKRVG